MSHSEAVAWTPVEIPLEATESYERSYVDVEVSATFEHESGEQLCIPGFWNGENKWLVRFSPTKPGDWEWKTDTSVDDDGLVASGSLAVESPDDPNQLREHGFLRVGDDGRHFVYDDDEPFFWLGDTVWSAGAKATTEEWQQYLDTRRRQGYSVIQLNSLPQHDASKPQNRLPFGEEWNFDDPDPTYFQALDGLVAEVADRGLIPAMVVLWFDYVAGARDGDAEDRPMTPEQAARYGQYVGARYGSYGAAWLVSGDIRDEPEGMETFEPAAEAIGDAVTHPLRTMHFVGGQATPDYVNDRDWLEFHMFQSGHTADPEAASALAEECHALEPARPIVNGEPCYERIREYTTETEITREDARQAAWVSVVTGANAGVTYGAHGLWPWHREGEDFENGDTWGQPATWDEALEFPGGEDYARLGSVLKEIGFVGLEPSLELLEGEEARTAIAADGTILGYLEERTSLTIRADLDTAEWMNPATGDRETAAVEDGPVGTQVDHPSWEGDSVLIGKRS